MPDPMRLLRAGVPLSLLIDLLEEAGPSSQAILRSEPDDLRRTVGLRAAS